MPSSERVSGMLTSAHLPGNAFRGMLVDQANEIIAIETELGNRQKAETELTERMNALAQQLTELQKTSGSLRSAIEAYRNDSKFITQVAAIVARQDARVTEMENKASELEQRLEANSGAVRAAIAAAEEVWRTAATENPQKPLSTGITGGSSPSHCDSH